MTIAVPHDDRAVVAAVMFLGMLVALAAMPGVATLSSVVVGLLPAGIVAPAIPPLVGKRRHGSQD
jgi:hypothetical protein